MLTTQWQPTGTGNAHKSEREGGNERGKLTPGNVCFSCRAFWALRALSGLKYVRNAQPVIITVFLYISYHEYVITQKKKNKKRSTHIHIN